MDAKMKTVAYALPHADLLKVRDGLRAGGYAVSYSRDAGTLVAKLDGLVICRALQMGSSWCLRAVPGLFNAEEAK